MRLRAQDTTLEGEITPQLSLGMMYSRGEGQDEQWEAPTGGPCKLSVRIDPGVDPLHLAHANPQRRGALRKTSSGIPSQLLGQRRLSVSTAVFRVDSAEHVGELIRRADSFLNQDPLHGLSCQSE
jgi:hypothetical protein